jgi:hypothetical protein
VALAPGMAGSILLNCLQRAIHRPWMHCILSQKVEANAKASRQRKNTNLSLSVFVCESADESDLVSSVYTIVNLCTETDQPLIWEVFF